MRTLHQYDKQIPKAPTNVFTMHDYDSFYGEYDDYWDGIVGHYDDYVDMDKTLIMVEEDGLSVTYVSYYHYSFWPPEYCDIDYVLANTDEYDLEFGTGAQEEATKMFPEYFI